MKTLTLMSRWQCRFNRALACFGISAFLLTGPSSATYAQLTDSGIHPPPTTGTYGYNTFKPGSAGFPAVGQTYTDPVFGSVVKRLTDVTGRANGDDIYAHHWSNADGTYAFNRSTGNVDILMVATGQKVYTNQTWGLDGGDIFWDALDPDKYYYFSGTNLMRRNLAAQTSTVMKTFPGTLQSVGGSLNIQDRSGRYFTVRYSGTNKVWDSQTNTIYAGSVTPVDSSGGWTTISPDGNYLVDAASAANESYSYPINHTTQTIGPGTMFWNLCGDHGDVISASDGKTYFITGNCNNIPAIYRVDVTQNEVGRTPAQVSADNQVLIPVTWTDAGHYSCVGKGTYQDWCFYSSESIIDGFDSSTAGWTAYKQEIIAVNVLTLEVRRFAHHRSRGITVAYSNSPRVSCSWDGSVVMWVSDYDVSSPTGYADLYTIQSPLGSVQPPLPAPTNLRVIQ